MNYWWVNHKQTFKQENGGNYIWAPKENIGGVKSTFYTNLTLTKPGDIIFSYANAMIMAIGVVSATFQERTKPLEYGTAGENWPINGWYVPAKWVNLDIPFSPKQLYLDMPSLFPKPYSPLNLHGGGNQGCYLAQISFNLYSELMKCIKKNNACTESVDELHETITEDVIEHEIATDKISETVKQQLILARIGQGLYKTNLCKIEKACRITGLRNRNLLIASHIKAWKDSSNEERLDGQNGLLLSPHIDKLFDRHMISFRDDGMLVVYSKVAEDALRYWKIDQNTNVGAFTPIQKRYMQIHRSICEIKIL